MAFLSVRLSPLLAGDLFDDIDFDSKDDGLEDMDLDALKKDVGPKKIVPPKVYRPLRGEPPHWPIGVPFPGQTKPEPGKKRIPPPMVTDAYVWVPKGMKHLRAALVIVPDQGSKQFGQHPAVRKLAEKHEMGILYLLNYQEKRDPGRIASILAEVAKYTRIREFRYVPWILLNGPNNANFALSVAAKQPNRTVATIGYHAPAPSWPRQSWAPNSPVLHVNVNGEFDDSSAWSWQHRPRLLNYQLTSGWLSHMVVPRGVADGDYPSRDAARGGPTRADVSDYLTTFMDKALALRVPGGNYATNKPPVLKKVDPSRGVLVETYAMEDIFRTVRGPMKKTGNVYDAPGSQRRQRLSDGYAAIPPMKEMVPAGVPVEPLVLGKAPKRWLVTEGVPFLMKQDPWLGLGKWLDVRPQPGTTTDIDGKLQTFKPLKEIWQRPDGGIGLSQGYQQREFFSFLGYTVLEVTEPKAVRLKAYTSTKGRLQIAINGQHVDDGQIIQFSKGRYPVIFAMRLQHFWESVRFWFVAASDADVAKAKARATALAAARKARRASLDAPARPPASFVHSYGSVKAADRPHMFWLPDKQVADAWLKLHQLAPKAPEMVASVKPKPRQAPKTTTGTSPKPKPKPAPRETPQAPLKWPGAGEDGWPAVIAGHVPVKPGEHPRLFFRKTDLSALRKRARTPEGKAIINRLRYLLNGSDGESMPTTFNPERGPLKEDGSAPKYVVRPGTYTYSHAAGYGFLHLLTGEKKYADMARKCMEIGLGGCRDKDRRYSFRHPHGALRAGPSLGWTAVCYDICYNGWDEEFRRKVAKALNDYNEGRAMSIEGLVVGSSHHPGSNHWGMQVGGGALAILAIAGDPGTDNAKIQKLLEASPKALIRNMTQGFGDHGWFREGCGTGSMSSQIAFVPALQAWMNVGGLDLVSPRSNGQWLTLKWHLLTIWNGGRPLYPSRGMYPHNIWARGSVSGAGYFCEGFGVMNDDQKAAMLWIYNNWVRDRDIRSGTPYDTTTPYPHHCILAFVNWPLGLEPRNPAGIIPQAVGDENTFYMFRNRWKDKNDIALSIQTRPTRGYGRSHTDGQAMIYALGQNMREWGTIKKPVACFRGAKDGSGVITGVDGTSFGVDFSGASGATAMLVQASTNALPGKVVSLASIKVSFSFIGGGAAPPQVKGNKIAVGKQTVSLGEFGIEFGVMAKVAEEHYPEKIFAEYRLRRKLAADIRKALVLIEKGDKNGAKVLLQEVAKHSKLPQAAEALKHLTRVRDSMMLEKDELDLVD